MGKQTQPIEWLHVLKCNRCGCRVEFRTGAETFDWSAWCNENGWREEGGRYRERHTCPDCLAKQVPGCAQQAKGGVWHRYDWRQDWSGDAWSDHFISPQTKRPCSRFIDGNWHDVRPGEEPPEGAKLCKRCYPNGREE